MSQNVRVALWVPTATPPDASGDTVATTGLPDALKKIPTQFSLGGGGGILEAPTDGQQYARKNAAWSVVVGGGGGGTVEEAPLDDQQYVRQSGLWVVLPPSGSVEEAPTDDKPYVRFNSSWLAFDIIDAGTF